QPDPSGRAAREMRVRMRVDGVLTEATTVPKKMVPGVVSRIKIMADLDIAERRIPQDGRVGLTIDGRHVDVRVVTIPSVHGEGVVMRILDKESIRLELDKLGFQEHELARFRKSFSQAYGCVLTTGPTGSGKATSRSSTRPRRTSSRSRIRSSTRSGESPRSRSTTRPASRSPPVCAR